MTFAAANTAFGRGSGFSISNGATLQYTGGNALSNRTITLANSSGGVIDVSTSGTNLTLTGAISGTGPLTKSGSGTLTLSGTKTYTGETIINGGTLSGGSIANSGSNSAFGAGSGFSISNGAILEYTGAAGSTNRSITLGSGGGAIRVGNSSPLTINGVVSGIGGLTKTSNGTVTLSGNNSYSGITTIGIGTLSGDTIADSGLNSSFGAGTAFTLNTATLEYTGGSASTNRTMTVNSSFSTIDVTNSGTTLVVSGVVSGTGGLRKEGNGTLTLSGSNSYSGTTTVWAGTLSGKTIADSGSNSAFGAGSSLSIGNGATLRYTGGTASTNRTITVNDSVIDITMSGAVLTFNGVVSGAGAELTKSGAGTLVLNAANTYHDGTIIAAGTLSLGSGGTTGSLWLTSGITVHGNLTFNRSNAVVQGTDFSASAITGAGSLTKSGTGSLALNAANSYGGGTTVSSGTLYANNSSGSATGSGTVTVNSGGTLAGTGAVSGAVIVNSGGTVALGASIESLDVGALTFNSGATMAYEINSNLSLNVAADLVNANGDLDIFAGAVLNLVDLGSTLLAGGTKFTLISYAGTWNSGIFVGYANGGLVNLGDNTYQIRYDDTSLGSLNFGGGEYDGNVTLTSIAAVPEASAFVFFGLACVTLAAAHFGRKLLRHRAAL